MFSTEIHEALPEVWGMEVHSTPGRDSGLLQHCTTTFAKVYQIVTERKYTRWIFSGFYGPNQNNDR